MAIPGNTRLARDGAQAKRGGADLTAPQGHQDDWRWLCSHGHRGRWSSFEEAESNRKRHSCGGDTTVISLNEAEP